MEKYIKSLLIFTLVICVFSVTAQKKKDWDKINVGKEYGIDFTKFKSVSKSLKNSPAFISDYKIQQFFEQKGNNHKGGGSTMFSTVGLSGISQEAYQITINELYTDLFNGLKGIGLEMADGEKVVNSANAQSMHDGKKNIAEVHSGRLADGKIDGAGKYAIYRPMEPQYYTNKKIYGTYYQKLAKKEDVNMFMVSYTVTFAGFEASRGKSSKYLSTGPYMTVRLDMYINNPKGAYSIIHFKDAPIEANNDWSLGIDKDAEKDGSFWGISSSYDYTLKADEEKFLSELSSLIKAMQKGIVEEMKKELK